jgi:hypothetical protein
MMRRFSTMKLFTIKMRDMFRRWIVPFLAVFTLGACQLPAQTSSSQDFHFQVSTFQPWTDTGLDLQTGDTVEIEELAAETMQTGATTSAPSACTPADTGSLPLPSAAALALIARLHAQGASPILVGKQTTLHIEEPSHLFLGLNAIGSDKCVAGFNVTVHRIPGGAAASTSSAASTSNNEQNRKEELKSQLASAAQVFMSGQFGMGKSESASSSAVASTTPLEVSSAPLDRDLREDLDSLPRRVNDQFQNLGDMVNFVIIGQQKDIQTALDAASWHIADTGNKKAVLDALQETYENKDYLQMPMSTLYLFGRKQDFGYEMAEPIAMVASRHHFRIWKAPFTWKGQEVWVGAGTHDVGFAKDKRNNSVTHKIDPAVDGERENIGTSLQKANQVKSMSYYLPANPVQDAKNATGDGYHSDGRLLVIFVH